MNLSNILKDPIDILLLLIYVTGVLILVYSAMQFIHGILYKDKTATASGIKTLIISLLLLVPRLSYQHFRIDGSDYEKSVKASLESIALVHDGATASTHEEFKNQMDALSERLTDDAYDVELQTSVENDGSGEYTIRNLSAVKSASGNTDDADIILISTSLDESRDTDFSYAADLSVIEAIAHRLCNYDSSVELRFLVSTDKRQGQDAAGFYIDSLDNKVKERIRCAIDLDMKSLSDYTGLLGYTINGRNNPVSGRLISSVKKMTGQSMDIKQFKDAGYISFHLKDIPSVCLEQATVENSTSARSIEELDIDQIADAAAVIADAILPSVKSDDSELMRELASLDVSDYCAGSFIKDKDHFVTGSSLTEISEAYGTSLVSTGAKDSYGNELYSGKLYILTFDHCSNVVFHVNDGRLLKITIDTQSLPCSQSELSQILNNLFGDSETTEHGHVWTDAGSGASYCILDVSSKEALTDMISGGYCFYIEAAS